jgi:hypothetical protein
MMEMLMMVSGFVCNFVGLKRIDYVTEEVDGGTAPRGCGGV